MDLFHDPLEPRPLEDCLQQVIDGVRAVTKRSNVGISATFVSRPQAASWLVWPQRCALDVEGETVQGFKSLEAYADTDAATLAISQTSGLLLRLMQQLGGLKRQVETVIAQLGGVFDIKPQRANAGQEGAELA